MKNKCIDCGGKVSKKEVKRCIKCIKILRKNNPESTSGFKDGRTLIKHYCQICNKELVNYKAKHCEYCKSIGILNPAFIDGRSLKTYHCKICDKEITWGTVIYGSGHCKSCSAKKRIGEFASNYKDGKSLKKHYCLDCKIKLSDYRVIRCQSCETIRRYTLGILSPEKTQPEAELEKLLKKLFYKKYKFVGNGKYWITNFNPDFVNSKSKKIIELYGDYWHNREDAKKRDELRIPTYKKYGYKTLIIWEKELKNIIKLTKKLGDFNGK